MSVELPPLPPAHTVGGRTVNIEMFTAEQMHAYARDAADAALELAARACEIVSHNSPRDLTYQEACADCAAAVDAARSKEQK